MGLANHAFGFHAPGAIVQVGKLASDLSVEGLQLVLQVRFDCISTASGFARPRGL